MKYLAYFENIKGVWDERYVGDETNIDFAFQGEPKNHADQTIDGFTHRLAIQALAGL